MMAFVKGHKGWNKGMRKPLAPCAHPGCDRLESRSAGFGLCRPHYYRQKNGLPADLPVKRPSGGWTSVHGYRYHGNRGEHRLVMERILGRTLAFNEVVHHIDGNKQNNDPSNLRVMDRGAHIRLHILGKTNEQRAEEKRLYGYVLAEEKP